MAIEISEEVSKTKTSKALLWISIISMTMLFAGLTSAYVIRQAKGDWLVFELPTQFFYSTVIIVLSSASLFWALASAKKNNFSSVIYGSGTTLLLAMAFIVSQVKGWNFLVENGIFFTGPGSSVSASFLYVITALHVGHVIGGVISLLVVFTNSLLKKYDSKKILGLQLCSIYWHFLGILWIYLFLFLLFIR